MSNIRKQSIISSVIVYFGFALGFINTYLFTKKGSFTPEQYGLINLFIAIANIMFSVANLGMLSFINKFYPYYKDNLEKKKNDLLTLAISICILGFSLVVVAGFVFKEIVVQKYSTNSPELVTYYYWLFPFGFGLTLYSVLEAYAWQEQKSVLTNFLREVLWRLFTTILIVLFFVGIIPRFPAFIKWYALTYIFLSLVLGMYLLVSGKITIYFSISRVTKKFYKKIIALAGFVWGGGLVYNIAFVFDTLVIAAVMPNGLVNAGIYSLAQNIASLIQAPQRGIISASVGPLSRAWKDKDLDRIKQIYKRSSINQLIFSVAMFCLIFMNFTDGIHTFSLKETYTLALPAFLFIGLMRILDMGTGLNSQIIGTSVFWRFEFFTGIVLLTLTLPLNYLLTKTFGVIGPAMSNLFAFTVYNFIRCMYLWKKLRMQPFSPQTFYTLIVGGVCYGLTYLVFRSNGGLAWIIARSAMFITLFGAGAMYLKLTPDLFHIIDSVKGRIRKKV
ncbi:MAG: lipopolysaccharide biosynthesis protein [Flavitalea sp.]